VFHGLSFSFVVFGSGLLVKVWFVFIVLTLEVTPRIASKSQVLFRHTISSYFGVSRIEFLFCCLWTRFVSEGVVGLHSVGFGGSWTFTVIFLNVSRGSTLFVSLYISFA
jgi:hypothetical protein